MAEFPIGIGQSKATCGGGGGGIQVLT